jgi:hypothetical protein
MFSIAWHDKYIRFWLAMPTYANPHPLLSLCLPKLKKNPQVELFFRDGCNIAHNYVQYTSIGRHHRYLMSRLSLQVVYLWRHVQCHLLYYGGQI